MRYRLQLAEAFLKAEVREVVGADFIAQERGELLVLFDECVPVRPDLGDHPKPAIRDHLKTGQR